MNLQIKDRQAMPHTKPTANTTAQRHTVNVKHIGDNHKDTIQTYNWGEEWGTALERSVAKRHWGV